MQCDVAVIGLGGMGSAIAAHCATRGASVIGVEQYGPGHELGSSVGRTRLIRKAYFEAPDYVPLLHRAYELWRELEAVTGEQLLRITGILSLGDESSAIITGTQRAAREHNLAVDLLSAAEVRARYATLQVRDNEVGVFEHDGGVLAPERAVAAHLQVAAAHWRELRFGTQMRSWRARGESFEVQLADESVIHAAALVLALGPWFRDTLESLGVPIRVQRNVQAWFAPATDAYAAPHFPGFLLDRPGMRAPLYGFPGIRRWRESGVSRRRRPDDRRRDEPHRRFPTRRRADRARPSQLDARRGGTFREAKACLYTLTPDEHFVVDRHPEHGPADPVRRLLRPRL
jgi:sarcosine oxidase